MKSHRKNYLPSVLSKLLCACLEGTWHAHYIIAITYWSIFVFFFFNYFLEWVISRMTSRIKTLTWKINFLALTCLTFTSQKHPKTTFRQDPLRPEVGKPLFWRDFTIFAIKVSLSFMPIIHDCSFLGEDLSFLFPLQ